MEKEELLRQSGAKPCYLTLPCMMIWKIFGFEILFVFGNFEEITNSPLFNIT